MHMFSFIASIPPPIPYAIVAPNNMYTGVFYISRISFEYVTRQVYNSITNCAINPTIVVIPAAPTNEFEFSIPNLHTILLIAIANNTAVPIYYIFVMIVSMLFTISILFLCVPLTILVAPSRFLCYFVPYISIIIVPIICIPIGIYCYLLLCVLTNLNNIAYNVAMVNMRNTFAGIVTLRLYTILLIALLAFTLLFIAFLVA